VATRLGINCAIVVECSYSARHEGEFRRSTRIISQAVGMLVVLP
jgi:hypothetical protein